MGMGSDMQEGKTVSSLMLANYDTLTASEKRIADYMLHHTAEATTLNASEIAERCSTSNTTVTRFVKELGFESFSQLRLNLARETARETVPQSDDVSFSSFESSVRLVLRNKIAELNETVVNLDVDALKDAVQVIVHSDNVLVAGVGTSLSFAQMFALKLSHVGVKAVSSASIDAEMVLAQLYSTEDCIIFVSNSGSSRRLSTLMGIAQDASIKTIAITGNGESPIAQAADISISVVRRDRMLTPDFDSSHNALNFIADVIVTLLFHMNQDASEYIRLFHKTFGEEKNEMGEEQGQSEQGVSPLRVQQGNTS
ncbi:MAG: MurR/RpiR family transcriptional regulator [Coriobacteriaceae bacterium]|nr:MAG: MurR/RpiR family transcriptional regulator [Coriobacteriaceae bacterium]